MYRTFDFWLQRLQWPIAIIAAVWLPIIAWACLRLAKTVWQAPFHTLLFLSGIGVFILGWRWIFRFQQVGLWLMRAEHEATHLLFAVLTGHPIVGWSRQSRQGSYIRFLGHGNWLIQIAPYFFPTAAVVLWLVALLIPFGSLLGLTSLALGFATGFHVVSTWREIYRDRDELLALSSRFCWLFLPSANLLMLGGLIAYSQDGFRRLATFLSDVSFPLSWGLRGAWSWVAASVLG
jgi:hypothetical protein